MTSVNLDGDFTEPEFSRHLFVHEPRRHKRHDLSFARSERLETLAEFGKRLVTIPSLAIPFDRVRDGIEHVLIAERLCQEIDSSSLHGPDGHRNVSMGCHHDNRNMNV